MDNLFVKMSERLEEKYAKDYKNKGGYKGPSSSEAEDSLTN